MSKLRDNIARMTLVFTALALLGGGLYLRQVHMDKQKAQARQKKLAENQKLLLDHLRSKPLFKAGPVGNSHQTPEAVMEVVKVAREAQIDPLACYYLSTPEDNLRFSLAYMLLVTGRDEYVDHVRRNLERIPDGEVELWVVVLEMGNRSQVDEQIRRELSTLAQKSDAPAGLWYAARRRRAVGLTEDAVDYMLRLLDSPSAEGAAAAKSLCDMDRHVSEATEYLWRLAESDDPDLAHEGLRRLAQVKNATTWPEYRRYSVESSEENRSALIDRLRETET
jgi:hypothetical protein